MIVDSSFEPELRRTPLLSSMLQFGMQSVAAAGMHGPADNHASDEPSRGVARDGEKALAEDSAVGGAAPGAASAAEQVVELGFNRVTHTGVQAFRIPFEDFAACADGGREGGKVTPLQLVVDAVSATRIDYSVFGSTLIEILLEFKWKGFARRKYLIDLTFYVIQCADRKPYL